MAPVSIVDIGTAHLDPIAMSHPPAPPTDLLDMPQSPCGWAPTEGVSLVAQAVLHRELFHVHASLALVQTLLRQPLAIRSTPFLARVTCPQLRGQLQGLDSTLLLGLRATHSALHYTHELLTAWVAAHPSS